MAHDTLTDEQLTERLRSVEQLCNEARVRLTKSPHYADEWIDVLDALADATEDLKKATGEIERRHLNAEERPR
jgi:hypothetical protein